MNTQQQSCVAVFATHTQAEDAIKELQQSGFDMTKLSIVGQEYHTDEHVVGYYNAGDRMAYWGRLGAFWGGLWGVLVGSAFFWIPGVGPIAVAGPVAGWIVGALEGAAIGGGMSVLGAAFASIGIPKDSVVNYETAVKAGKYVVVVHGTTNDVSQAKEMLSRSTSESVDVHQAA